MSISGYSKFHRNLDILASQEMAIDLIEGDIVCHRADDKTPTEKNQAKVNAILNYLLENRAHVRSHDSEKLSRLRVRLENAAEDTKQIHEVFDLLINKKEAADQESDIHPLRLTYFVKETPESHAELLENLQLLLHNPNYTLTPSLAVVDAYNFELPSSWSREEIFDSLTDAMEQYVEDKGTIELIKKIRTEYREVQTSNWQIIIGRQADAVLLSALYTAAIQQMPIITTKDVADSLYFELSEIKESYLYSVYIQEPGNLVLLIPLHSSAEEIGVNPETLQPFLGQEMSASDTSLSEDLAKILTSDDDETIYKRTFALLGHGLPQTDEREAYVSGVPLTEFREMLLALSERGAELGVVDSCYSGGASSEAFEIPGGGLPFPLIVRNSTESVSIASGTFTYDATLHSIKQGLEKVGALLFALPPTGRAARPSKQLTLQQLRVAAEEITTDIPRVEVTNMPTLFLPTSSSDIPRVAYCYSSSPNVLDVGSTHRQEITTKRASLLFSSPLFTGTIDCQGDSPRLISRGGTSHHVIRKMRLKNTTLELLALNSWNALEPAKTGYPVKEHGAEKLFFIGELELDAGRFNNVTLIKHLDQAEIFYQVPSKSGYYRLTFRFNGKEFVRYGEEAAITAEEYHYQLYLGLAATTPSDSYIRQTTAGRLERSEIYEEISHHLPQSEDVLLYDRVLQNKGGLKGNKEALRNGAALAAYAGSLRSLQELARELQTVNSADSHGLTLLMSAAQAGNLPLIEWLVESSANLNAQDETGRAALHWAVYYNQSASVRLLLEKGADTTLQDASQMTAVEWLVLNNQPSLAALCNSNGQAPPTTQEIRQRHFTPPIERYILQSYQLYKDDPHLLAQWTQQTLKNFPQFGEEVKKLVTDQQWDEAWEAIAQDPAALANAAGESLCPLPSKSTYPTIISFALNSGNEELIKRVYQHPEAISAAEKYMNLQGVVMNPDATSLLIRYFPDLFKNNPKAHFDLMSNLGNLSITVDVKLVNVLINNQLIDEDRWPLLMDMVINGRHFDISKIQWEHVENLEQLASSGAFKKAMIIALARGESTKSDELAKLGVKLSSEDLSDHLDLILQEIALADTPQAIAIFEEIGYPFNAETYQILFIKAIFMGSPLLISELSKKGCKIRPEDQQAKELLLRSPHYPAIAALVQSGESVLLSANNIEAASYLLRNNLPFGWDDPKSAQKALLKRIEEGKAPDAALFLHHGDLPALDSPLLFDHMIAIIQSQRFDDPKSGTSLRLKRLMQLRFDHSPRTDSYYSQDSILLQELIHYTPAWNINSVEYYPFNFKPDSIIYTKYLEFMLENEEEIPPISDSIKKLLMLGAEIPPEMQAKAEKVLLFFLEIGDDHAAALLNKQGVTLERRVAIEKLEGMTSAGRKEGWKYEDFRLAERLIKQFPDWKTSDENRTFLLNEALQKRSYPLLMWAKNAGGAASDIKIPLEDISIYEETPAAFITELFELISSDPKNATLFLVKALICNYEAAKQIKAPLEKEAFLEEVLTLLDDGLYETTLQLILYNRGWKPSEEMKRRILEIAIEGGFVPLIRWAKERGATLSKEVTEKCLLDHCTKDHFLEEMVSLEVNFSEELVDKILEKVYQHKENVKGLAALFDEQFPFHRHKRKLEQLLFKITRHNLGDEELALALILMEHGMETFSLQFLAARLIHNRQFDAVEKMIKQGYQPLFQDLKEVLSPIILGDMQMLDWALKTLFSKEEAEKLANAFIFNSLDYGQLAVYQRLKTALSPKNLD